jgi:hypothetical protein
MTIVKKVVGGYDFIPSNCPHCKAPTLDQSPNYDSCENCGYWHCYSDGEGNDCLSGCCPCLGSKTVHQR